MPSNDYQEIMNIKTWWENLLDRERRMIVASMMIVSVLSGYLLIWNPLSEAVFKREKQVEAQLQLLTYLQQASQKISQWKSAGIFIDTTEQNGELLTLVEQTLSSQSLSHYLKQVQQPQNNQIVLTFHHVPFDQLMQWLQMLLMTHGVCLQNLSANRLAVTGTADVRVVLRK